ncbi:MAG: FmdB family zinc ribbon protein [Candidatus Dormibacteria bacterium]
MPIYVYRCQSCSNEFELMQKMTDPPVATCPSCNGTSSRVILPAGVVFKGSGFYKTDSRSQSSDSSS